MDLGAKVLIVFLVILFNYEWTLCQTVHKLAVKSDIRFRFATTEVTCHMSNDDQNARELMFDVTLPKDAFIANFSMLIEGKEYPGHVKAKQEAREQYLSALSRGHSGGLVEQRPRHSNAFDVSVNIASGSNVTFKLIYQELLRRRFGWYEHSIHVSNNTEVRDLSIEIYIQERTEIKEVRTPVLRTDVMKNDAVEETINTLTEITRPTPTSAHVIYRPTPRQAAQDGAGWFAVQYDVETAEAGELLVVDGYFVHFFIPSENLQPLPLDIVFVLDTSGSMLGGPVEQLKEAMNTILEDLKETDRFNIILFDSSVNLWKDQLMKANKYNVDQARMFVRRIHASGGTNLHLALLRGLEMLRDQRTGSRVPMLFFLTDGEATAGETRSDRIIAEVSEKNGAMVNIYSLAFGGSADYNLLKQISAKNNGFARKIYEASDAAMQVTGLYREIATVVLLNLKITYHSNERETVDRLITIDNTTLTTCVFPTLFGAADVVVAGRIEDVNPVIINVSGQGASGKIHFILTENSLNQLTLNGAEQNPFWNVDRDLSAITERTWAYLTIKQLLQQKLALQENTEVAKDLDARILSISLKYNFVTPLTSMVVTRPEDSKRDQKKNETFDSFHDGEAAETRERTTTQVQLPMSVAYQPLHEMSHFAPFLPKKSYYGDLGKGFPKTHKDIRHHNLWIPSSYDQGNRPHPRRKGSKRGRPIKRKMMEKNCIRKIVLEAVSIHHQLGNVTCYGIRQRPRVVTNYTLLEHAADGFKVIVTKEQNWVKAVYIGMAGEVKKVDINKDGDLMLRSPYSATLSDTYTVINNDYVVNIKAKKQACPIVSLAIEIQVGTNDVNVLTGVVADDLKTVSRKENGRKLQRGESRGKGSTKKKSC